MSAKWDTVVSERTNNEVSKGRKVVGGYGKDYILDEDGNEVSKPRVVRGRGRPRAEDAEPKFNAGTELDSILLGWTEKTQENQEDMNVVD